ncbi:MAG: CapA family protein [bacterium]
MLKRVIFYPLFVLLLLLLYLISGRFVLSYAAKKHPLKESSYISYIKFNCVGDVFLHDSNLKSAETKDGFEFKASFQEISSALRDADITSCWLGGVFDTTGPYTGYPLFKSPDELLTALHESGFDLMLRTNHTMDYYEEGLESTTNLIEKNGMIQLGAFLTEEKSREIYVAVKDSLKVAVLSYTYGLNGLKPKHSWEVAMIDTAKIRSDIERAKNISDFIVLFLHYGTEYSREPSEYQKRIARFCAEAGAGIIVGSHPHVIEPVETLVTKDNRIVYSAYSLGNFFCGQRKEHTDCGMILSFIVEKSSRTNSKAIVKSISYKPTYVKKYLSENSYKFKIVLSEEYSDSSDKEIFNRIKESAEETKCLMRLISGNR